MSLKEVLAETRSVASKVDDLMTEVNALKRREKGRERCWNTLSKVRSNSPLQSPLSDLPDGLRAWDDPSYVGGKDLGWEETLERNRMTTHR